MNIYCFCFFDYFCLVYVSFFWFFIIKGCIVLVLNVEELDGFLGLKL